MDNKRYDLSNVLVTGASGNIGKAICSILKYNKINFKKLSKYNKSKRFSLENTKSVQKLSKIINPSLIIHSAIDNKFKPNLNVNILMMKNLIKFFKCPIIYISSISVYSGLKQNYLSEKIDKYILDTKYSLVKKKCEDILISRRFKKDLCIRMPGLFSSTRKDGVIFHLMKRFKNKEYKISFFDLDKQWQCIHLKHFKFYFIKILKMKINYINVINIGYTDSISINKMIKILNNELPKTKKIMIKNKSRTTRLNLNRLKKITNKTFKLEQGIKLLLRSNEK
jgi:nucleoside-diphosphate-sugar epimerase